MARPSLALPCAFGHPLSSPEKEIPSHCAPGCWVLWSLLLWLTLDAGLFLAAALPRIICPLSLGRLESCLGDCHLQLHHQFF